MSNLLPNVLVFGRLLRSQGLDVHPGRLVDVADALLHIDLGDRDEVYYTCRALLVHRREDLGVFDRAFDLFWRERTASLARDKAQALAPPTRDASNSDRTRPVGQPGARSPSDDSEGDGETADAAQTWSDAARLVHKDFAIFTPDEISLARAALDRLKWNPGERRSRRWVRGNGPRIDLRRALAESLRTGGDLRKLPRRRRRMRPRPVVLLCDISGSMERYSRLLLHFAHGIRRRHRRVEVFLFATRLTRITSELRARGIDDAVNAAAHRVPDWSSGTRIGASLRELHQQWSRRLLRGGPVVLLISDGWDCGDPLELRNEMARLRRSAHRLVWLNPLIGTPGYAPLTRGLQAALPFVHDFLPARTLTNLSDLALHLNALTHR